MNNKIYLSLCIPTNGIIEWVVPVIESIYRDNEIPISEFEVIVSDNGENEQFFLIMNKYCELYSNFIYKRSNSIGFLNQIDCFEVASGEMIKFLNHRLILINGTLRRLVEISKKQCRVKPQMFFTNGSLKIANKTFIINTFDEYVKEISYMASWSGGTSFWRSDFDKLKQENYNILFPHIPFVLTDLERSNYLVDNFKYFENLEVDEKKKGKYNLYKAFSIEFPSMILKLVNESKITWKTYYKILNDLQLFLAQQYLEYNILKKPCSYNLEQFINQTNVYFSSNKIKFIAYIKFLKRIALK